MPRKQLPKSRVSGEFFSLPYVVRRCLSVLIFLTYIPFVKHCCSPVPRWSTWNAFQLLKLAALLKKNSLLKNDFADYVLVFLTRTFNVESKSVEIEYSVENVEKIDLAHILTLFIGSTSVLNR